MLLIESVHRFVVKASRRLAGSGMSVEELQAEGVLAAVEAKDTCVLDRAHGFAGCAYVLIRNRLLELCRISSTAAVGARSWPERMLRYRLARPVAGWESQGYDTAYALRLAAAELGVPHEHAAAALAVRSPERIGAGRADDDGEGVVEIAADADPVEVGLDRGRVSQC
jgi:hypothetical protein